MQFCKNLTIYDRECNYLAEYFNPLFFYDLEKIKKVNYQSINAREIFRDQLLSWPSFVQFTNVTRLFSNLLGSFSRATKLWFLSKRANSLKAKNWEHMHWIEVKVCTIHGISTLNLTNPFPIQLPAFTHVIGQPNFRIPNPQCLQQNFVYLIFCLIKIRTNSQQCHL